MLLSSLGISIANVALPTLAVVFDASFQAVQWVVLAYLLAITGSLVAAGRLGDRIGRRKLLRIALIVFTTASVATGLASQLSLVILARAVQGLGAAAMMALTLAFVNDVVPKAKTGSAMGLLGTMSAIGTALGPSLGGVLIDLLGWRSIFLVNAPLGLLAVVLVHRYLPADRPTLTARRAGLAIYLEMLRDRALVSGLIANLLVSTVLMATLVVGPFYLSLALGLDMRIVGLVMSAGPIVSALTGVPAGRIVDRFGVRRMTLAGLGGIAAGSLMLAAIPESLGVLGYVAPIVVITMNYAMFQAANNTAVMSGVGPDRRGVVSGLLNLSRNLGLIAGTSVMGSVFALASSTSDLASAAPEAIATGMRITFALAGALALVALAVNTKVRALALSLALLALPSIASAKEPERPNGPRIVGLLQPQLEHPGGFSINRARIGLVGTLLDKQLQYTFVADFGGGTPRLTFLNIDHAFADGWLTVRVGQFKRPFSRSFVTMASQLSTIDRPSTVGPKVFGDDADIGVMLHNGSDRPFEYAVGIFNGTGPNVVPEHVHPLLAVRVGYNTGGMNPYSESDLEGGPARFGVAAAALVDFDADGDGESYTSALVDVMFKARGLSLSSAFYFGTRQAGPRWSDQRPSALGHHTQLGYVIADQFEPVVRWSSVLRDGGEDQHDASGGLNVFVRGHALKWQNFVTVRFQPDDAGFVPRDVLLQSQLTLAF